MRWLVLITLCFGCGATAAEKKNPARPECTKGNPNTIPGATQDRWSRMADKKTCINTRGGNVSSDEVRPREPEKKK